MASERVAEIFNERVDRLSSQHVSKLTNRQQDSLVLLAAGCDEPQAARLLGIALHTLQNHLHEARYKVVPDGLPPDRPTSSAWTWLHQSCCVASSFDRVGRSPAFAELDVQSLRKLHRAQLAPPHRALLSLSAAGCTDLEMSAAMEVSPSAIRARSRTLRCELLPPSVPPTRGYQDAWAWAHARCCEIFPAVGVDRTSQKDGRR